MATTTIKDEPKPEAVDAPQDDAYAEVEAEMDADIEREGIEYEQVLESRLKGMAPAPQAKPKSKPKPKKFSGTPSGARDAWITRRGGGQIEDDLPRIAAVSWGHFKLANRTPLSVFRESFRLIERAPSDQVPSLRSRMARAKQVLTAQWLHSQRNSGIPEGSLLRTLDSLLSGESLSYAGTPPGAEKAWETRRRGYPLPETPASKGGSPPPHHWKNGPGMYLADHPEDFAGAGMADAPDDLKALVTSTDKRYRTAEGHWTPERQALHERILDQMDNEYRAADDLAMRSVSGKPIAIFLGGGPAAGKSTALQGFLAIPKGAAVIINSDDIKDHIPEYRQVQADDVLWPAAATVVHNESNVLGKELFRRTVSKRASFLYDMTMANPRRALTQMQEAKAAGYEVQVYFNDVPTDEGVRRMMERTEQGATNVSKRRYVPINLVRDTYQRAPKSFAAVAPQVADTWVLISNDVPRGVPPIKVVERLKGGRPRIVNRHKYEDFLRRNTLARINGETEAPDGRPHSRLGSDPDQREVRLARRMGPGGPGARARADGQRTAISHGALHDRGAAAGPGGRLAPRRYEGTPEGAVKGWETRRRGYPVPDETAVPSLFRWGTPTPEAFIAARNRTSRPGFLSPLVPEDIKDHKLFTTEDGTVGFAISPDGDIQNVFNNGGPKGAGAEAMLAAIRRGGNTLDCYDGFLPTFYSQLGFEETGRIKFNPEYAHGWDTAKYDHPDVVFMAWAGLPAPLEELRPVLSDKQKWSGHAISQRYYPGEQWDAAKADARGAATAGPHYAHAGQGVGGEERRVDLGAGAVLGRVVVYTSEAAKKAWITRKMEGWVSKAKKKAPGNTFVVMPGEEDKLAARIKVLEEKGYLIPRKPNAAQQVKAIELAERADSVMPELDALTEEITGLKPGEQAMGPQAWQDLSEKEKVDIQAAFLSSPTPEMIENAKPLWEGSLANKTMKRDAFILKINADQDWNEEAVLDSLATAQTGLVDGTPLGRKQILKALSGSYLMTTPEGTPLPLPRDLTMDDLYSDRFASAVKQLYPAESSVGVVDLIKKAQQQFVYARTKAIDDGAPTMPTQAMPDWWLTDKSKEIAENQWGYMQEAEKFDWAKASGLVTSTTPASKGGKLPLPKVWKTEVDGEDYTRTQTIGRTLVHKRYAQLMGRPNDPVIEEHSDIIARRVWGAWKGDSHSPGGLALQYYAAREIGTNHRLTPKQIESAQEYAAYNFVPWDKNQAPADRAALAEKKMRAYIRAQWETTQYILRRANVKELETYRALKLARTKLGTENSIAPSGAAWSSGDPAYTELPDLTLKQNGAASSSTKLSMVNSWQGVGKLKKSNKATRVVLRIKAPPTALLSIPVFGQNLYNEQEYVVLGTPWNGWDVWKSTAPAFQDIPTSDQRKKGARFAMSQARQIAVIDLNDPEQTGDGHWLHAENFPPEAQVQTEKPHAFFDEAKHKRDQRGRFAPKEGGLSPILMDPHETVWRSADPLASHYGMLVMDPSGQRILLREPTNHYQGYTWTFARGTREAGEAPLETAVREAREEYGLEVDVRGTLPDVLFSTPGGWASLYYVATPSGPTGATDWETSRTRWATFPEAIRLIQRSGNRAGRARDLRTLMAVYRRTRRP